MLGDTSAEAKLFVLSKKGVTDPLVLAKQLARQPLGIRRKLREWELLLVYRNQKQRQL